MTNKNRHSRVSKPIPIGAHHTVSGHEAMDLAKRLTDELASQQSHQGGSLGSQRNASPEQEPRARSFEQKNTKTKGKFYAMLSPYLCVSIFQDYWFLGDHNHYQSLQAVNNRGKEFVLFIFDLFLVFYLTLKPDKMNKHALIINLQKNWIIGIITIYQINTILHTKK